MKKERKKKKMRRREEKRREEKRREEKRREEKRREEKELLFKYLLLLLRWKVHVPDSCCEIIGGRGYDVLRVGRALQTTHGKAMAEENSQLSRRKTKIPHLGKSKTEKIKKERKQERKTNKE